MTMIEPKQARSAATRRRLLDAAVEILIEDGYLGLSAATVARRAGVSRGAHQHHFPDRTTLLIEALRHLSESELERLRERIAEIGDGEARLAETLDLMFEAYRGDLFAVTLELALASRREPELRAAILEVEHAMGRFTHVYAEGVLNADGEAMPDSGARLNYTSGVIRGVAVLGFLGHPPEVLDRHWEFARTQVIATLQTRRDSAGG